MNPLLLATPVLVALGWWLWRRLREEAPRALRSRARLIDGGNHIPVSVTLLRSRIEFFNSQFATSVELDTVESIEYVSDLFTGDIGEGALMRVKSQGRAFDFVMDSAAARQWSHALPPR